METLRVQCCVVGGGPAGMMLGFLLARAGVRVAVLEKHKDFLRDFRGDTIHPSTLEIMNDLGLLADFLKLPHQKLEVIEARVEGTEVEVADFRHLGSTCPFIALMPQWDFLDFLAERGRRLPNFDLRMETEATDLVQEEGHVTGVRTKTPSGELTVLADLVVACDGRRSRLRDAAGLHVEKLGAPMDVVWFRLPRHQADRIRSGGTFSAGRIFITIDRGDYWQCAYVIPKGGFEALKAEGVAAFREKLAALLPFDPARTEEIRDWDQVSLLTVAVDRLAKWHRPGLLCIGDAAHAMSPIGGVGVNLAIQDAVASANILAAKLRAGLVEDGDLVAVQRRRLGPTRVIQGLQLLVQDRIVSPTLGRRRELEAAGPPFPFRLATHIPGRTRMLARLIGLGIRPERVHAPEAARQNSAA